MRTDVDNAEADFNAQLGHMVATLMKVNSRQVNDLAALFGWHRNNAADKLAGRTRFSPYEVKLIADWLGTSPGVLYGPVDALFQPGVLAAPVARPEARSLRSVSPGAPEGLPTRRKFALRWKSPTTPITVRTSLATKRAA